MRLIRLAPVAVATLLALGCFSFRPANVPLEKVDPSRGYRPQSTQRHNPGNTWFLLAFSGGGTRAAAFAFGVLEELRDTEITVDGQSLRMLDEVDGISGVSGGSFPAAYYGLYGDRIFDELPERFLYRNVQRSLIWRMLNPWNTLRLMTPLLSRTELASQYYDTHIFEGATFADLAASEGPNIHINATDLTLGNRITFSQEGFDLICTDLDPLPVSTAVAASSAVPILFSALTLENYGGRCGFELPEFAREALDQRVTNPRGYRVAVSMQEYLDPSAKRFIHLVDGGISDNLGLRVPLDRIALMGDIERYREHVGAEVPEQLIVIAVNAETAPDPAIDLNYAAPSLARALNLVSGSQIRRFNFETLQLIRDSVADWSRGLSKPEDPVEGYFVEVSFDLLEDEEERRYLKHLPTSFSLDEEEVDRLREAGRRILRESPEYQAVIEELR